MSLEGRRIDSFVAMWKALRLPDGRDRVVRHGHGPNRAIQTGSGRYLTFWCGAARGRRCLGFHKYFSEPNAKLEIAYQLCVGMDQKRCPKSLLFVIGDLDTVSERVEKECEGYSRHS
jgi:hypothetical protein